MKRRFDFKLILGAIGLSAMTYSAHIFLDYSDQRREDGIEPSTPVASAPAGQALAFSEPADCEAFVRAHSVISDMASNI